MMNPEPCPFCGETPYINPTDPKTQGDAWASVECVSETCLVGPVLRIFDDHFICDDDGEWLETSQDIKEAAVRLWNKRPITTTINGGQNENT